MAKISQKSVDQVLQSADILDVVRDYVELTQAGKNYRGLCPFHSEKTPSFFVSPEKNLFHCFGCGEKGGAVRFIEKIKNIPFPEAVKVLAEKYHVPLEIEGTEYVSSSQRYYDLMEKASNFYQVQLTNFDSGKKALQYIQNRGLDLHTIQYFEIGYAPQDASSLTQALKNEYEPIDMMECGLTQKKENDYYDLFRDRLMFPIRNEYGKTIAFSGRIIENKEGESKYVNSPQTRIFLKGSTLYHLDKAIPFIQREKRAVLFEGFLDVISAFLSGVKEGVCTMGTALTNEHCQLLKKYTDNVVICYDGDKAGIEAAHKAEKLLSSFQLNVSVVLIPEGLDPDEYRKKYSSGALQRLLHEGVMDPIEFQYNYLKQGVHLNQPTQVENFKLKVFEFLISKDSQTLMEFYVGRLAKDLSISTDSVRSDLRFFQLSKAITKQLSDKKQSIAAATIQNKSQMTERDLMNYYLESEEYRQRIIDEIGAQFSKDPLNVLIQATADDLIDRGVADLRGSVIQYFTNSKDHEAVRQRLSSKIGEYNELGLDQTIRTKKIINIEDEIDELRRKQEISRDYDDDLQLFNQYQLQIHEKKKTISELKKEQKWKKTKS